MATAPPQTEPARLEDEAATAALYVSRAEKAEKANSNYMTADQKLSSAGAAASLKYANPKDLPSYPTLGLSSKDSSAGAAASLANARKKDLELWHPDPSTSASKAALLAKDYKSPEIWQPEVDQNGSKAALLAARDGGSVDIWQPGKSAYGNSAAAQAMKSSGGLSPKLDYGYTTDGHRRSLMAATGAMARSRKRSESTPIPRDTYPDESNSSANALNAATIANRSPTKLRGGLPAPETLSSQMNIGRVHNAAKSNVSRDLYTSHPTIGPAAEDKNRQDVLRAAAVSMAKQMYDIQQKTIDDAAANDRNQGLQAARSVHGRYPSITSTTDSIPPSSQYNNLEEAARRLAAERLAKLHDEHASYRNYYGTTPPQRRLSVMNRMRRRASSDGATIDEDQQQSRRIRTQMSLFSDNLAQVDVKKRQKDREALLAAAQKNVTASMHGIDKQVFADTGRVAPSMLEEWEVKARAVAERDSKARMTNYGKVDIGGGKFLDQKDVDAVATKNVQPLLDEINLKAEKQRARELEAKLDEEERKRKVQTEKSRDAEIKAEQKRLKEQEKADERKRKESEKAQKAEEKRLAREEKNKSKQESTVVAARETEAIKAAKAESAAKEAKAKETTTAAGTGTETTVPASSADPPGNASPASLVPTEEATSPTAGPAVMTGVSTAPTSPKSGSKAKGWFSMDRVRSRRLSKQGGQGTILPMSFYSRDKEKGNDNITGDKSPVDGPTMSGGDGGEPEFDHAAEPDGGRDDSLREVAMAGRDTDPVSPATIPDVPALAEPQREERSPSPSISPVSEERGRTGFGDWIRGARKGPQEEEHEHEHEHKPDEAELAPPPTLGRAEREGKSPVRDSKFVEQL